MRQEWLKLPKNGSLEVMDKSSHVAARPRVASPDPQRTVKTLRATHDDDTVGHQHFQEYYEPFRECFSSLLLKLGFGNPHLYCVISRSRV
jgi:hypothetical protein